MIILWYNLLDEQLFISRRCCKFVGICSNYFHLNYPHVGFLDDPAHKIITLTKCHSLHRGRHPYRAILPESCSTAYHNGN
ncbi:MAG: membrane protein insertion efficiency factor YidD [Treponema sp.]|nr:membrane protein insertion efficiency factor YidD [Treponema sp.]